ncbi:hypothetical protein ABHI18_011842, partial [Aspergillus niger]
MTVGAVGPRSFPESGATAADLLSALDTFLLLASPVQLVQEDPAL